MANNLSKIRRLRGWTQDVAAEKMGTTRNQLAKLEGSARRLSDKWIQRAAEAFEVDQGEIVTERGRTVQVIGYVGAGAEAHLYSDAQGPFDDVRAPANATDDTVAVIVRGDSLGSFFDRWLIFYDDVRRPVTPDLIGHLCVVGLPNGQVLVKKIKATRSRGLYHLVGQFGDPIMDTPIEWAARVKELRPQ
jgi:transcriptional regulator with XRE-family HTH domain